MPTTFSWYHSSDESVGWKVRRERTVEELLDFIEMGLRSGKELVFRCLRSFALVQSQEGAIRSDLPLIERSMDFSFRQDRVSVEGRLA